MWIFPNLLRASASHRHLKCGITSTVKPKLLYAVAIGSVLKPRTTQTAKETLRGSVHKLKGQKHTHRKETTHDSTQHLN